jgi:two-component system cell cycle response regulator CtrA
MDEPELKIIDVFICKLRKKLSEATNGQNFIETVGDVDMSCVIQNPSTSSNQWQLALKQSATTHE